MSGKKTCQSPNIVIRNHTRCPKKRGYFFGDDRCGIVELWSGEFEAALEYVVLAILLALQLSALLYKKASVERALCRTKEALASISDFLALSPGD